MNVDCRYEGTMSECCLESAAIDRIFYNLATNACRHAAGDHIDMAIFPIPEPPGDCLRFVLSNEVDEAVRGWHPTCRATSPRDCKASLSERTCLDIT